MLDAVLSPILLSIRTGSSKMQRSKKLIKAVCQEQLNSVHVGIELDYLCEYSQALVCPAMSIVLCCGLPMLPCLAGIGLLIKYFALKHVLFYESAIPLWRDGKRKEFFYWLLLLFLICIVFVQLVLFNKYFFSSLFFLILFFYVTVLSSRFCLLFNFFFASLLLCFFSSWFNFFIFNFLFFTVFLHVLFTATTHIFLMFFTGTLIKWGGWVIQLAVLAHFLFASAMLVSANQVDFESKDGKGLKEYAVGLYAIHPLGFISVILLMGGAKCKKNS